MNIDLELAGAVMLSGLAIVFTALIILIAAVIVMGRLLGVKSKAKPQPELKPASPSPVAAPSIPAPVPTVQAGISNEVVAAISAAVACTMSESAPGSAYTVTNIQRSGTSNGASRPVWGFAGMQQNTRPF